VQEGGPVIGDAKLMDRHDWKPRRFPEFEILPGKGEARYRVQFTAFRSGSGFVNLHTSIEGFTPIPLPAGYFQILAPGVLTPAATFSRT
jgi:hypothetical protein